MDIIKDYKELIRGYLDAPEVFIEASAYHIVSACLGRFFRCSFIPGGQFGARPNIWFIIASIPGRTRRSTIANYATYTYRRSLEKYYCETQHFEEKKSKKVVLNTIIEEGTPEGITDHINATKLAAYAIMSTEFGSVLTRIGTKDYEMGVSSLFSKMYYGEGGTMMLSQRNKDAPGGGKRFLPEGLYTTMFCGMQEPHLYLTPGMSRQGLLRRIILCYCDPKDIDRWMPPLHDERENVYTDLWNLTEDITDRMLDYQKKASQFSPYLLDITFHPQAMNMINKYAQENDKKLQNEVTNLNIYRQSFWEHFAKLAMLNAISRDNIVNVAGEWVAFVTLDDARRAKSFLDRATKHSSDIMSRLGSLDEPIQTARDPLERIYQIISSAETGILRKDLYRKANMRANQLQELLSTLLIQEKIKKVEGTSRGGRPPVYYEKRND